LLGTVTKQGAKITKMCVTTNTVQLLNDKKELWSFGLGDRFQLGNNSGSNVATPVQPIYKDSPLENIELMAVGHYHSLAVDTDNRLYGWGTGNTYGSLVKTFNNNAGRDAGNRYKASPYNTHDSATSYGFQSGGHAVTTNPMMLNDGSGRVLPDSVGRIVDIQCGSYATYILNEDGELFSCGYNEHGQLGQRHLAKHHDVSIVANILHNSFGQVYPYASVLDARIKKVVPGGNHCFVIMEDNKLFGWGNNDNYQLGLSEGNTEGRIYKTKHDTPVFIADDVEDVFTGNSTSAYKKLDGSVYVMGNNNNGQIAGWGDGRTLGLDRYDDIFGLKDETSHAKMPIPWFEASDNILEIAFGDYHSVIKRTKKNSSDQNYVEWWSAGSNLYGQRGIGRDPAGENNKWTVSDQQEKDSQGLVTFMGSDKWASVKAMQLD
jgi:alpha-tubulin suppressor-like RCC1 family protein